MHPIKAQGPRLYILHVNGPMADWIRKTCKLAIYDCQYTITVVDRVSLSYPHNNNIST